MLLNERNSSANSSAEINMADTTWIIVNSNQNIFYNFMLNLIKIYKFCSF